MAATPYVIEKYKAKDGLRWRLRSRHNSKIVAESGEAYANRGSLNRAVSAFKRNSGTLSKTEDSWIAA